MRTRSRAGLAIEQEHRNSGVALLSTDKLIRTTNERQVLLTHVMHAHDLLVNLACRKAEGFRRKLSVTSG